MYFTFVMLKPDALKREIAEQVMRYFTREGIQIELFGYRVCTPELVCAHYEEVIERIGGNFKRNSLRVFDGKAVIPVLLRSENPDIIEKVRRIVGKTDPRKAEKGTIRSDFGLDSMELSAKEDRIVENVIHASDSPEAVKREAELWFGAERMNAYFSQKTE